MAARSLRLMASRTGAGTTSSELAGELKLINRQDENKAVTKLLVVIIYLYLQLPLARMKLNILTSRSN